MHHRHLTSALLVTAAALSSLACLTGGGDGGGYHEPTYTPPPAPRANIVIGAINVSWDCAGFFSGACSRADCTVINAGDAVGRVNVELVVTSAGGQELTHGESLVLDPGSRKTVQYDFEGFQAATADCTTR